MMTCCQDGRRDWVTCRRIRSSLTAPCGRTWCGTAVVGYQMRRYGVLEQVNAAHLVKRFRKGLDAFVVNYHTSFSGGECQRLALARVLLRKPSVLLLDEATSSLDAENEATVMEVLAGLKEKITIVFVTHRESVTKWFDEVIKI